MFAHRIPAALPLLQAAAADAGAAVEVHHSGFILRLRSGCWLLPTTPRLIEALHLLTGRGPR